MSTKARVWLSKASNAGFLIAQTELASAAHYAKARLELESQNRE